MQHWHAGRLGSLRMGVVHGGWCIGCCWALMAALFALGVMSLGWMALIAALIAAACEAITFAGKQGLDLAKVYKVITGAAGAACSGVGVGCAGAAET